MIEKMKTLAWFARRPSFWAHAVALTRRKLQADLDSSELRQSATQWAAGQSASVETALVKLGLMHEGQDAPRINPAVLADGEARAARSMVRMGGAGDLDLLFAATKLMGATTAVETGVAYGWSSLAVLAGQSNITDARLLSVDMPYPKTNNEVFVGIVVPDEFRFRWTLIREPDRNGIKRAIKTAQRPIDLVHYDSDKSYQGRRYAYPLLWNALRSGGIFISDDIQDNMAFRDFIAQKNVPFAITASQGKYVGIARKP